MKNNRSNTFKKILVPTDFTPLSMDAIGYAIGMAKAFDARLILFHAFHVPLDAGKQLIEVTTEEEMKANASMKLKALRDKLRIQTGFHDIEYKYGFGLAVDAICQAADDTFADLLVMATSGSSGLDEILLGSNTSEVAGRCTCPVLVVPQGSKFQVPERILFATNYADNDFQSIFLLTQFFRVFRPEIILVHVEDKGNHRVELDRMLVFQHQVKRNIPYDRIGFLLVKGESVLDALDDHLANSKYDLIATSTRRRNLFDRLTSRSLTKNIINHSGLPLIAFHAVQKTATPLF